MNPFNTFARRFSTVAMDSLLAATAAAQPIFIKKTYRIYEDQPFYLRKSTGVTLKDGTFLQVVPEKQHFASRDDWRRTYPLEWETRRELTTAERERTLGCGCHWEVALEPLEPIVAPGENRDLTSEEIAMYEKFELDRLRNDAAFMGFMLVPKTEVASIRDKLDTLLKTLS